MNLSGYAGGGGGGDDSDDGGDGGGEGQIVISHGRLPGSMLHLPPAADWSQVITHLYCTVLYCTVLYCTDHKS